MRTLGRRDTTTVDRAIVPGPPSERGYTHLEVAKGEGHLVRCDLGGARSADLVPLCVFSQLSDLHVTDAQSPARAEYLDRHGDDDDPLAAVLGRVGLYRPQESLTVQVLGSMVVALNRVERGPVTGAPVRFSVATGDLIDNAQANELTWYLGLLDGVGQVSGDSGSPSRYEGVGALEFYDRRYWHPDGTPGGEQDDLPRALRGFPVVPGLLDAARRPVRGPGLDNEWFAVYGNHDALIGGTLPATEPLTSLVTGPMKAVALADGISPLDLLLSNEHAPSVGLWGVASGPMRAVTSDRGRALVDFSAFRDAHLSSGGAPNGHGFLAGSTRAHYTFDRGAVRFIALDTVNRSGGWQGSIDDEQFSWLEAELVRSHKWHRDRTGRRVSGGGDDRLVVLLSHHPLSTLVNDFGGGRVLGDEVGRLVERFPNVVAWVNGHTHEHRITAHPRRDGGGWWEITTSSHVDWPQQARIFEIAHDRHGQDLVIATTVIDHAGVIDPRSGDLDDPATLSGWSRELSANAWQGRAAGVAVGRGTARDRNALLMVPAPFRIAGR